MEMEIRRIRSTVGGNIGHLTERDRPEEVISSIVNMYFVVLRLDSAFLCNDYIKFTDSCVCC
jgi:hypothetical protein